jgi:predicted nucleic acid-binding Zn ribbon protein
VSVEGSHNDDSVTSKCSNSPPNDLPLSAVAAAREKASRAPKEQGFSRNSLRPRRRYSVDLPWSGPAQDGRDPAALEGLLLDLVGARGWQADIAAGRVVGRWPEIVGSEVARHCQPVSLAHGDLTVDADSTAWATQFRMLVPQLLSRLNNDVGQDVVRRVLVRGPAGPSWRRGPRTVPGRGPRDTYG